jgi:rhodanese-related sulfurtransferase
MAVEKKVRPGSCLVQACGLVLCAVALGFATKWLHPRSPAWSIDAGSAFNERIALAEVDEWFGGEVLWLDVRSPAAFASGHVPGALRVDVGDPAGWLYENFDVLVTETRPVVVYGISPEAGAAKRVADYLRANTKLSPVVVLRGGWSAWLEAGHRTQVSR